MCIRKRGIIQMLYIYHTNTHKLYNIGLQSLFYFFLFFLDNRQNDENKI